MAGLLIGVLLGPGEEALLCPFQLMHATMCEDFAITCDISPSEVQRHNTTEALLLLLHLYSTRMLL